MKLTPLESEAVEQVTTALAVVAALMGDRSAAATPAFRGWLETLADRVATLQTVAMCERSSEPPRGAETPPASPRAMLSPRLMVVERTAPGYAPDVPATASDARTGDTPTSGGSGERRPVACSPLAGAYPRGWCHERATTGTGPNCDLGVLRALAGGPCCNGPAGMPNLSAAACRGWSDAAAGVAADIGEQCGGVE